MAFGPIPVTAMPWNYETGREEQAPYNGGEGGPVSCAPPKIFSQGCMEILLWEQAETAWRMSRYWMPDTPVAGVLAIWEKAEMAVLGWDKASQKENFRRGYMNWLASTDGVGDALSDLEIEQLPMIDRIIARGYRELAKTEHPDVGGTAARFAALRKAKAQLDQVMREVGELLEKE